MGKNRILYVCHNHPSIRPGGVEVYAQELYEAVRAEGTFEPIFVAKGGQPMGNGRLPHLGTFFGPVDADPNQYFVYSEGYQFDGLLGSMSGKEFYTKHFREFLLACRPSVVHLQHTLFLGYDLIREVRNSLPLAPIVYTLHEYLPICHRQGQMLRTVNGKELCDHESPQRCHECFPNVTPQSFFLRKRFIQSHFSLVDLFIAPSRFLRQRYIDWGIPAEKIRYEENGRLPMPAHMGEPRTERHQSRFGFFGQISEFKGVDVLLKAMQLLAAGPAAAQSPRLTVHGASLEIQAGTFQNQIRALLAASEKNVVFAGPYQATDLPRLMSQVDWVVVPSIWWENSPLVIQEAFAHGRPVICSDIGGMAEKVADGVNGIHFRAGDPRSLADAIRTAAGTPGLWHRLRAGIPPVHDMATHVQTLIGLYNSLLQQRAASHAA